MDDLAENCAFQLGLVRTIKAAGIDGPRLDIVLDLASQLATVDSPTNEQVLEAAKRASALYLL